MKRLVLVAVAVLTSVVPTAALAKGASEAQIAGPGLENPISLAGEGRPGGQQLMQIAEQAGFFPAVFGQSPDPMLTDEPTGDLGPRYTITYVVPGPNNEVDTITQALYPYAKPAPVTQMASGQSFFGTEETRGGWFVASSSLKDSLVATGLPANVPAGGDDDGLPTTLAGVLVGLIGAVVLLVLAGRRIRRRPGAATA